MKKFSVKELSRIETAIDEEIAFVKLRQERAMRTQVDSAKAATIVAKDAINSYLGRLTTLVDAKFAIRAIKQDFNAEKGINDKTQKIAKLLLEQAALDTVSQYSDVRRTESYSSNKVTYTPGISMEMQDEYRAKSRVIQRQIQRLKDSCQGINNQGSITLDEVTYATLVSAGLIDA